MRGAVGLLAVWTLAAASAAGAELDALGFLVGAWRSEADGARMEEHWIAADGGTMLGVSRVVVSGKTVAFEFLRIERREDGRIFYIAQPNGRPGVEFELTRVDGGEAVFENPEHDHPKLIRYRRTLDGGLTATIEGEPGGRPESQDFRFRPFS